MDQFRFVDHIFNGVDSSGEKYKLYLHQKEDSLLLVPANVEDAVLLNELVALLPVWQSQITVLNNPGCCQYCTVVLSNIHIIQNHDKILVHDVIEELKYIHQNHVAIIKKMIFSNPSLHIFSKSVVRLDSRLAGSKICMHEFIYIYDFTKIFVGVICNDEVAATLEKTLLPYRHSHNRFTVKTYVDRGGLLVEYNYVHVAVINSDGRLELDMYRTALFARNPKTLLLDFISCKELGRHKYKHQYHK